MAARTIAQVLTSMRESLVGSPLSDFSPYSNVYILYRAVAIAMAEQDSLIEGMVSGFHLATATGTDLDKRANDYGLTRLAGGGAKGWVLAKSSESVLLPAGVLLTDPSSRYQYEVRGKVYVGVGIEIPIYIQATSGTSSSNLPQGTYLTSSFYPSMSFVVGRYRDTSTGAAIGAIEGGSDRESDTSLRARLLQHLRNHSTSNRDSIYLAVRSVPGISRVMLVEHDPITGYFTVYVDTNDSTILTKVRAVVDTVKAAGISYLVRPMVPTPINIEISVSGARDIDTDVLRAEITSMIENTPPASPIYLDAMRAIALKVAGVSRVVSIAPNTDILPIGQGQVYIAGTIKIITTSGA
ncbi:baseplate J-like protein [Microcoleus phage My-WqHQDG]|nr:baseplate J-like protein [Microcoleus phage My-WqHQDG]